jgi:hypothetical protein
MPRGGARPGAGRKKSLIKPKERPQTRGGVREGAGRKPGRPAKKKPAHPAPIEVTREVIRESRATGETPLEYMLRVMRTPVTAVTQEGKEVLDLSHEDRRDRMAMAAAPYLHARLSGVAFQMARPPTEMAGAFGLTGNDSGEEIEEAGALEVARRVAFTLALGYQKTKKTG